MRPPPPELGLADVGDVGCGARGAGAELGGLEWVGIEAGTSTVTVLVAWTVLVRVTVDAGAVTVEVVEVVMVDAGAVTVKVL